MKMRDSNDKGSVLFSVRNTLKAEMPSTYEAYSLDTLCFFETLSKLSGASPSYYQILLLLFAWRNAQKNRPLTFQASLCYGYKKRIDYI